MNRKYPPRRDWWDQNSRHKLCARCRPQASSPVLQSAPSFVEARIMGIIRASAFSVSIDGFAAGLHQTVDNPFGERGMALPDWMLKTRMFHTMTAGTAAAPVSTTD